jgi:hypothetical protein
MPESSESKLAESKLAEAIAAEHIAAESIAASRADLTLHFGTSCPPAGHCIAEAQR